MPKVGGKYPTWFSGSPDGMSVIIAITPYRGRYNFTHVLRVSAPRTQRGWMELCYGG
jgi:hypothetical protein